MTTTDPSPMPAAALLRLYQSSGSEDALRQLILRYLPLVHATARRCTGSESLAADVVQTVLIDFARQARSMPPGVQIGGWLLRHTGFRASRALRTERRRAAREAEAVRRAQLHPPATMSGRSPHHSLIAAALHRLPAREQSLLVLKYYDGLELPAIAAQLGISSAAAQKRTERAIHRLRRLLSGSTPSENSGDLSTAALTVMIGTLLSRHAQAAGTPPSQAQAAQWTSEALRAAAARPMPAPLVRLRHLGALPGSLGGIVAALALSAVPVWQAWSQPPGTPAVALAPSRGSPVGATEKGSVPDIDDVFSKLKALVNREGHNRLAWRKAEGLIMSLPRWEYEEAIVRIDRMFRRSAVSPTSAGPDRWIMLLLHHWKPASMPEALRGLLPRLSPGIRDYAAMMLCQDWHRKSPAATAAWLQTLLADNDHRLLPEDSRRILVPRLAYVVIQDLMASDPGAARALGDRLQAGGFQVIQVSALRNLKAGSDMAAREAILSEEHPWYQPVKEVLDDRHTPAEKRALADKIGDPAVRQILAELLAARLFDERSSGSVGNVRETQETADWLLGQTPSGRRARVLESIARASLGMDTGHLETWLIARAPEARSLLDQEKSRQALQAGVSPETSAATALGIKDPELRDYTLAARLAAERDAPADTPSVLNTPSLPEANASDLRQWLAIIP